MKLYPHQIEALEKTKDFNRCAYYYDMGLGKTFIGSEKMKQLGAKVNLVICQKSKINDWVNHFVENYEESENMMIYDLTKWKKKDWVTFTEDLMFENDRHKASKYVLVINYDLVFRRPELIKLHDFTLMLDESSLITNRTAKRSKFILKMNPTNVILLSGTPTAGKYEKLWSQIKLLGWNISEEMFWSSYVKYEWIDYGGFWDKKVYGYKNVDHLKRKLREYGAVFRKTKGVIDLPEQNDQYIYVNPSKEYKQFIKHDYIVIDDTELVGDTALTKILYQRQLCGQYSKEKLSAFKDLVESTEDRLIVFYNFTDELLKLIDISKEYNRPISVINGKSKMLDAYETQENSITFVQYQAGAYGLNLQKSNKIIYYSLPLGVGSCDLWEQSKKRIHRIGQDRPCFYYYLLTRNSIETWNMDLLKKGKDLTNNLFKETSK